MVKTNKKEMADQNAYIASKIKVTRFLQKYFNN